MGRAVAFIILVWAILFVGSISALAEEEKFLISFTACGDTYRALQGSVDIVRSFGTAYIALADREDMDKLEMLGTSFKALDNVNPSYNFYVVFLHSMETFEKVDSLSHILLVEGLMVLTRTTAQEATDIASMGLRVEKLYLDPVKLIGDPSLSPPFSPSSKLTESKQDALIRNQAMIATPNPLIESIVNAVSMSSLQTLVNTLVANGGYETRRADTSGGGTAAEYIHSKFESYGISGANLSYEDIDAGSDIFSDNVVAEIPGSVNSDDIIIIGAHYDSVCGSWSGPCHGDPDYSAPGADDNATGTAAVLEAARILSEYEFENTIRFVTFSAEEFGLLGSQYHADQAALRGENIIAMINIDMIGYIAGSDDPDVDIIIQDDDGPGDDATVAAADALRDQAIEAIDTYVTGFDRIREWAGSSWGATTDHRPFHRKGWPAIWFFEDKATYSPYIHSISDTVGPSLNDWDFMTNCTKSIVAALATFAVPVDDNPPPPAGWAATPAQTATPGNDIRGITLAELVNYSALLLIPIACMLVIRKKADKKHLKS